MPPSPVQIKEKLLKGIDEDTNIINTGIVLEVIALLERTALTRADLEVTRLGRYINDIRKKTSDKTISTRCKKLVKAWQQLALPPSSQNGSPASTGYSPASARLSNTPSHNVSPYLPSQSSPALLTTYARHTSPAVSRAVSPLIRQATRNDNGSASRKQKTAPVSPGRSASSNSKRISPAETRQPKNRTGPASYSPAAVSVRTPTLHSEVSVNTNKQFRNAASPSPGAIPLSTPANNLTHRSTNVDATNRVYAGNKKRRRSEDSITSDTSSIKKSKPLVNGESKVTERVKTPRVKTTVQIIAELQAQNKTSITTSDTINKIVTNQIQKEEDDINVSIVPASAKPRPRRKNGSLINPPEAPTDLSKTKSDMLHRFLHFQENLPTTSRLSEHDSVVNTIDVEPTSPKLPQPAVATIVDPYALLPPLDLDSIRWSDDDDDTACTSLGRNPITGEYPEGHVANHPENDPDERKLTKILTEDWHGVTGTNSSNRGTFHDWTDTFTINPSDCDKDNVYVLPYVDI